jgi:nucleoside-diphosphate-sugar epimerase
VPDQANQAWSGTDPFGLQCAAYRPARSYQRVYLWGYVDERDAAMACRLALSADISDLTDGNSASFMIIAAADTVMTQPSAELMRQVFPDVPLRGAISANATLLSIERARQVLGFEQQHSWRDHVPASVPG